MFPRGLPGVALLLLRLSAALALLIHCHLNRSELPLWLQLAAILVVLAICIGFLTPVVAGSSLLFHVTVWWAIGSIGLVALIVVSLDALALALLGPGAYSVDGYRFGRRVLVLPTA
jgi:hypothetical protein